ncbi:restriction endonuclease subunit S [Nocardia testacea]|uniref:restriction endonuclease subunit S n=1 Tax=Nocardia testacea TaxID=248551 RepID=UPI0009FEB05E|nr:restriction endonuclease subunit S [Nocardia testacea]
MTVYRSVPIGDVTTVRGGGTPTRSNADYYGGGIPWVTPKDMKSWSIDQSQVTLSEFGVQNSPAKLIPENSVLVVVRSGVLKHTIPVGINKVPVTINQDIKAIICGDSILPEYLARFIKERSEVILKWVRATTADNFPFDALRSLPIPLPPLNEQRRIAAILDRADTLRAKRRQAIALLDDLAQSLFIDMFGDPSSNPHGWPTRTIRDLIESTQYGTGEKAALTGETPVLRMGNLTSDGKIVVDDLKYLGGYVDERYIARQGDILFNRTNSAELVGKTALFKYSEPMAYAGYLIRVRVNAANTPDYVAAFLNTKYAKRILRGMCKSIVGMANINARELRSIAIAQPPLPLQQEFAERIDSVDSARSIHATALAHLDTLFASLQSRAFRGELWQTDLEHLEGEGLS